MDEAAGGVEDGEARSGPSSAGRRPAWGWGVRLPSAPSSGASASLAEVGERSGAGEASRLAVTGSLQSVLSVPPRALVVVGGIPGAGKTTLIRRWAATGNPVGVRDPEDIRVRWESWLGGRRGYRLWRPLVYLEHYSRLGAALLGRRTILLQDTATRRWVRWALALASWTTRRAAFMVWVDVTLAESFAGQQARGRWVRLESVLRHWQRWTDLRTRLVDVAATGEPRYTGVVLVDRAGARRLQLRVLPPGSVPAMAEIVRESAVGSVPEEN